MNPEHPQHPVHPERLQDLQDLRHPENRCRCRCLTDVAGWVGVGS